jgi:hypothetical protein
MRAESNVGEGRHMAYLDRESDRVLQSRSTVERLSNEMCAD